ncbi:MAG: hypothetical protein R2705_24820, partial [Ilumatobacteraceae bacterium]
LDARLLVVVAALTIGIGLLLRSSSELGQRHRDLSETHRFSDALGHSHDIAELGAIVIRDVSANVRAQRVGWWFSGGSAMPGRWFGDEDLARDVVGVIATSPIETWSPEVRSLEGPHLGRVAVVLADEAGGMGVLAVEHREGLVAQFTADDLQRLHMMGSQLSLALRAAILTAQTTHDAVHDRLTGLPTVAALDIGGIDPFAGGGSDADEGEWAAIYVDLCRFSEVNGIARPPAQRPAAPGVRREKARSSR